MLLRCYPKITDFVFEFLNRASWADYRFLPIHSYGFFVACGFFAAATLSVMELRRKEKLGLLTGEDAEITVGKAPELSETVFYFLFGFVVFFKIFGFSAFQQQLSAGILSMKDYMLSLNGSWIGGILGGGAMAAYYYFTQKKQALTQPQKKKIKIYPSDGIGDLVVIAAILGILGSILFNFLETDGSIQEIFNDPVAFFTSGLSVYGGLICAGLGFAVYAWKKKYHFGYFFDSIAPGFMLANGIGRIGCQVSGDGDWGLVNTAAKPDWLPQFLWADNYANHVAGCEQGIDMMVQGPGGEVYCQLIQPVYPTPIYEFMMCTVIFVILWSLRKQLTNKPGVLFGIFMMLIGIQRYAIEQWRDLGGRELHNYFGVQLRQSEEISIVLFVIGAIMAAYLWRKYKAAKI